MARTTVVELAVKGQQFLDGSLTGYSPETLRVMRVAFDEAWTLIERRYPKPKRDAARVRLAECIIDVSPRTEADLDTVRRMALDLFMILDRDEPLV